MRDRQEQARKLRAQTPAPADWCRRRHATRQCRALARSGREPVVACSDLFNEWRNVSQYLASTDLKGCAQTLSHWERVGPQDRGEGLLSWSGKALHCALVRQK